MIIVLVWQYRKRGGKGVKNIDYKKWAAIAICAGAAGVCLYFGVKLLFSFFLPFLIAWLLSLFITPAAEKFAKRTHLPIKLCAAVFFCLILLLLILLLGAAINRLLGELERLLASLLESEAFASLALDNSFDYFGTLVGKFPILGKFASGERYAVLRERVNVACAELLSRLVSSLGEAIPRLAARMITSLPNALLFAAVTVISGFYFCMDRRALENGMIRLLPKTVREYAASCKQGLKSASWGYLRAYLILLLLTFAELFVGFLILGVDYAFLIALITAAVDILPVLGVGTVLIPWAVVTLLQKNITLGVGLLILFSAVSVLRQILEPRIVGKSLGLHPLVALVASYVGWQLFGVLGMVAAPLVALFLKSVWGKTCGEGNFY